ncbi:hypothetical protein DPMN_129124, partial [Dreissena polymorpha]
MTSGVTTVGANLGDPEDYHVAFPGLPVDPLVSPATVGPWNNTPKFHVKTSKCTQ